MKIPSVKSVLPAAAALVWLSGLCFALYHVGGIVQVEAKKRHVLLGVPALADLDTRLINILTLGHRGLYDDFITIYALQYLIEPDILKLPATDVQKAIRTVSRHRPKIESFYMLSCFVLSLDMKSPELCEPVCLDGMAALPHSWRIPATQGFVYMSLLKDKARAALWYEMAGSKPGAPAYMKSLAGKLAAQAEINISDIEDTLRSLSEVEGGSRLTEFLEQQAKRRENR